MGPGGCMIDKGTENGPGWVYDRSGVIQKCFSLHEVLLSLD